MLTLLLLINIWIGDSNPIESVRFFYKVNDEVIEFSDSIYYDVESKPTKFNPIIELNETINSERFAKEYLCFVDVYRMIDDGSSKSEKDHYFGTMRMKNFKKYQTKWTFENGVDLETAFKASSSPLLNFHGWILDFYVIEKKEFLKKDRSPVYRKRLKIKYGE